MVAGAWPYAVSGLMFLVHFQIDILLIGVLEGEGQTGLYAAAVAFPSLFYLIPGATYRGYLRRRFHYWAEHDRPRLRTVHERGTRFMGLAGPLAGAAFSLPASIAVAGDIP